MRDRQAYINAGRSDPGDDQQMAEHPYDFVSLPARPARGVAIGHDRLPENRWSGVLKLVYRTETPLHVGSGFFESAEECGLRGRGPVRGIMRSKGEPVLPGSSWKGAVRSRFEAITGSCLTLAKKRATEWGDKVPDRLYDGEKDQRFFIKDPKVDALSSPKVKSRAHLKQRLSPADALFGCMGYRGRVCPGEGRIVGGKASEPLKVAPMNSPCMHRLARPGRLGSAGYDKWEIHEVEGRKFYYDGALVTERAIEGRGKNAFEKIDYITEGAEIHIEVRIRSASDAEIGALLIAAGQGADVGIVRFGKYKAAGLGKVRLLSVEPGLRSGGPRASRTGKSFDLGGATKLALESLVDGPALRELHQITTAWRKA